jgi:O-antigen ligase
VHSILNNGLQLTSLSCIEITADKNSMNELTKYYSEKWRKPVLLICITVMLTALLFSRALLSIGLIGFIATSLVHKNIWRQVKTFLSLPFLWSMSLLFVLPLTTGFWSEDLSQWSQILLIKLPLLLLPICFAGEYGFSFKDWQEIAFVFLIVIFGGVCWSSSQYFQNTTSIHAGYLKANTIATPLGNDHVRFSLLVAIAILTSIFLLVRDNKIFKRAVGVLLLIMVGIEIIYLHVLAVRTGLICFYITILFFIGWLWNRRSKIKFLLIACLFFPLIAYFIFPTFKNRISYLKFDLSLVQKNIYLPGSNDGNRFASIKAGLALVQQRPFTGVGFGDIKNETDKFYSKNYPLMKEQDKILPSSEWMMYGAGAGWPGIILFSMIMLIPFSVKAPHRNMFWWLLNIFMAFSYLFDIGLEVQYGVFIHAFMLLWWYKWLQLKE